MYVLVWYKATKVVNIQEEDNYTVSILSCARNLYKFKMIPRFERFRNMIRIKVSQVYQTKKLCVEQVTKCSFNGIYFWLCASNVQN